MHRHLVVRFLTAATLILTVHAAVATPYTSLFVLGDSLSDSGNAFVALGGRTSQPPFAPIPSLPYASGRFSNGPVWAEDLAGMLGLSAAPSLLGGSDYAFGGARTGPAGSIPPSLLDQSQTLLAAYPGGLPHNALYVVWGGSNDVRDAATSANPLAALKTAVANVGGIVQDLIGAGAGTILVPNVPNLGLTPAAQDAGVATDATLLSATFDTLLNSTLGGIRTLHPGTRLLGLDIFGLIDQVTSNPGAYGLTDVTNPCLSFGQANPNLAYCSDPNHYLFWDGIHPTAAGHEIIAIAARRAVPEPGTLFLTALGLVVLWRWTRPGPMPRAA
ncbi:MAG: SGNH/GDSL hydrolase family protein [Gammaproteobacteria bacterium]